MTKDDFSSIWLECIGFQWDDGNAEKNWGKHQVSQTECEQIFSNEPLLLLADEKHSKKKLRFHALGRADNGRLLFLVFTVRGQHIRVISARDMSRAERKIYEQG